MPVLSSPLLSGTAYQDQIALETEGVAVGAERFRRQHAKRREKGAGATTAGADDLIALWLPAMRAQVVAMKRLARGEAKRVASTNARTESRGIIFWGQAVQMLPSTDAALITLHTIVNGLLKQRRPKGDPLADLVVGSSRTGLCGDIGRNILAEVERRWLKKHDRDDYGEVQRILADKVKRRKLHVGPNHRVVARITGDRVIDLDHRRRVVHHLGAQLLYRWMNNSDLPAEGGGVVPAFKVWGQIVKPGKPHRRAMVSLSDAAIEFIGDRTEARCFYNPVRRPMYVPPVLWDDQDSRTLAGAYLRVKAPLIKNATPEQLEAAAASDLSGVRGGLDGLNQTPWRRFDFVFEVCEHLYEAGGFDRIPRPTPYELPPEAPEGCDPDELRAVKRARAKVYSDNVRLLGERNLFESMMAECYAAGGRTFWLPHSIDYRCRAYPEPSYLNFQRDKLCRGLLQFGEPVPLADRGMRWVKIQVANTFGHDKLLFDDRVKWVDRNMRRLVDMAKDPLEHRGWMEADAPFQALAAVRALVDEDAARRLPVEQDGTCNGLQQYAALGLDEADAALVNLTAAPTRSDVYEVVAGRLLALVRRALDEGPIMVKQARNHGKNREVWVADIRPDIERALPLIGRPVVKQPVMTTTYNATLNGFVNQLGASLPEAGLDVVTTKRIRFWLAQRIQMAIGELLQSAARFSAWFVHLCRAQTATGALFSYPAPVGMMVVQPYRRSPGSSLTTVLGDLKTLTWEAGEPARGRHAQASAPNIIHSLDATHMHRTSAACHRAGMPFAANHDSFVTAPGVCDELGVVLREEFVRLHEEPILERLRDHTVGIAGPDVQPVPERGSFNLREVLSSPSFFS